MSTKNNFLFLGFYPRRGTRASGWRPPFRHQGRLSRRRGQYQAFIERRGKNLIVFYLYALILKYLTKSSQVLIEKAKKITKIQNYIKSKNIKINPWMFFYKTRYTCPLKIEKICSKLWIFWKSQEFFVKAKRKPGFFFQKTKNFSWKPWGSQDCFPKSEEFF